MNLNVSPNKTITLVSLLTLNFLFFSCAPSEKNDLKDAQMCLNTSPASEARNCLTKIASDSSAQAYKLKCAAVFISEGYNTPSSFIDALDQLSSKPGSCTGGCSSTINALTSLTFKNDDNASATDRAQSDAVADEAFEYCSKSETSIFLQISSLFKIGTKAANIAFSLTSGAANTADTIKNAIGQISDADMGSIVQSTYSSSCQDTSSASDSTKKYCAELSTAVSGGATNEQIGACMKAKLANPSATCSN